MSHRINQKSFRLRLAGMLVLPPVLMAALAGALLWQINRLLSSEQKVSHTHEVIAQAYRIEKQLVNMESGERGYLITGDSNFLEPYRQGLSSIDSEFNKLARLISDNPAQLQRLAKLRAKRKQWEDFAREVIFLRDSAGAYRAYASKGIGQGLMDEMRAEIVLFVNIEEGFHDEQTRATQETVRYVVVGGLSLTVLLGVLLAVFARRQLIAVSQSYGQALTVAEEQAEAMRTSEEHYRSLFDSNPLPMWVHDVESPAFLAVNEAALRCYGYSREEFLAMTINDILPAENIPALLGTEKYASCGFNAPTVWRHRKKDGTIIDVEITSHALIFAGRSARIVLANDITERKRAAEKLRHSEERYRDLVENARDMIYTYDLDGNFTSINKAVEVSTGYARREAPRMNITQVLAPEYLEKARRMLTGRLAGNEEMVYDLEIVAKDSRRIAVEVSSRLVYQDGVPCGVQGIARDITERKRFEEALQREKEYTEHIISAAPTLIVGIAPDGTTTFINRAITRVTGREPEEIVGQNWWRINYPGEEYRQVDQLFEEFNQGRGVVNYEMTLTTKSGAKRTISWNSVNRLGEHGEIIEIIGIGADVTDRRELEDQLRQSQKMEAFGQLAGGVAHDFNNLLTVINGYSALLARWHSPGEPTRVSVEEIRKAGERAASLTRQLLAFSRKQVLQPKVLNLNSVVADVGKMLRRLIGEDIDLLTVSEPSLGQIKADPGQIEQVILNLAVNARDAMPQGGQLTIETANVYLDDEYVRRHIFVQPGQYVMLAVSDTGCGMNAETRERMFEPFFTTKEHGKGTGLGLSTVYGIVKQSGGDIWVYSEVGRGTTIKVYLPRVAEAVGNDETRDTTAKLPQGRETVLLAEDEEQVRRIARVILEMNGYRVLEASGGDEALSIYKQHEGQIDLVMTDVVMPQMSGRELAQILERLQPGIKVLYMSGYTDDAIVRHGLLDQEIAFLQKPFTPEALTCKVREVLDASQGG
jgi:two-component system, cell cycle sensor histidine kinase and response regulator CckA